MKTIWFDDLRGEEKENFQQQLLQAEKVLDKLRKIVYNRVKEVRNVSSTDYNCTSWSHLQAHQNGQVAAFEEILRLLPTNNDKGHHA